MAKTLTIKNIEVDQNNTVFVEFHKFSSDGDLLGYHRTSITPGSDISAHIEGVSTSLASENFTPVAAADVTRVTAIAEAAWTPDVLAAYEAAQAVVA